MKYRQQGHTQAIAAAKADISERSGRRIEKAEHSSRKPRHWRTRFMLGQDADDLLFRESRSFHCPPSG